MGRRNIILIGFMGAGKTSVGERLAKRVQRTLIDTDWMIEQMAGMTISEIFAVRGEEVFRALETKVLEQLIAEAEGEVISVGGGLPLREENRKLLNRLGSVIYLSVQPETVLERLKGDTTRPLLQGEHVEEKVRELLRTRGPVYEMAADRVIPVDGLTVDEIAERIVAKL